MSIVNAYLCPKSYSMSFINITTYHINIEHKTYHIVYQYIKISYAHINASYIIYEHINTLIYPHFEYQTSIHPYSLCEIVVSIYQSIIFHISYLSYIQSERIVQYIAVFWFGLPNQKIETFFQRYSLERGDFKNTYRRLGGIC